MRYDGEYFAKALRVKRAELGISQAKLAEMTGLTQSRLSKYEQQIAVPSFSTVVKLADAFGCELEDFAIAD